MIPKKATRSPGAPALLRLLIAAISLAAAAARAEHVIFTEVHYNPPAGQPEFIEIYNNTSTPYDMGTWYFSDGIDYTFPDFDPGNTGAHILKPFERILVSNVDESTLRTAYSIPGETRIFGPYTGSLDNAGETVSLSDKNGTVMTTLTYDDSGKWPVAPDGTGHTLTRINPNLSNAGWRNWTKSEAPGGTPGSGRPSDGDLPTTTTRVVEIDSVWTYDQNTGNQDLGTSWRELAFDDSGWEEGPGAFGFDGADVFGTPWDRASRITAYVRKEFQWTTEFSAAEIDVRAHVDDGVVVYLNGTEVGRFNMPGGTIAYDTPATAGREWDNLVDVVAGSDITALLQIGTNVLAVEVHNQSTGSSDLVFGGEADITATGLPPNALPGVVISEVHFGADDRVDWVELHVPGTSSVNASTLSLASINDLSNATGLSGSIPGGGYVSFDVDFPVEPNGNLELYLSRGNTVIDARKFDRDNSEESFQTLPPGGEIYGGPGHTRDAANDPSARITDIVINEIMYDAPSDQRNAEWIELYNRGGSAIDLSGWSFTSGINFDFPPGTSIDADGYLVIAADAACFTDSYGAIPVLGDWGGRLSDSGELLRLEDANGNLADEVDYLPEGDWPNMADGDGASMELRHPDMDNNAPTAWADSDESQTSDFQSFTYTADFERVPWNPLSGPQELHAHLVGDAHLIIKNVSLRRNNVGANLISNPDVMSPDNLSSKGWVTQGTHWASFMDAGDLNLISDGHGDNKANRGEVDIGALIFGDSYTLSFDARWVSGKPRLIMQTLDHGFGTSFLIPVPENLGTPGAPNSALLSSAAPTVTGVTHSPAVPKPSNPVRVSARVDSSAALTSVELVHRLDSTSGNGTWLRTPMIDDGTGLYSANISQYNGQSNIVQFYVEAKAGTVSTFQPRFGPDRPAMWIVDSRDMPDVFLRERFIISEYDRQALNTNIGHSPTFGYNFPRMSNHFFNATFIANESEIFYNAEIRKSGSPFTRSTNANIDHGKWKLPGDRLFRNRRRSVIDASGTGEGSNTPRFYDDRIARYFMYQLGHPVNEMEFVHSVINTLPFKLRENHEPISNDFLSRHFPEGTDGTLLRIDDEWRFTSDDGNSRQSRNADWSYKNSDNPVRYHSEWLLRTRETDYDYSNFIEWVRTLHENDFTEAEINRLGNADMLCLNAAVRGYDADWDTITVNRGKNAYFFRPKGDGPYGSGWMLMHWDGDRVFERSGQAILGNRTGVKTYFEKPYIKRRMNYYMTKLLDEHTRGSARTLAWINAEKAAVQGTGIADGTDGVLTNVDNCMNVYLNWFNNRESLARSFVGSTENNTSFAITTNNNPTTADTITLAGTAPPDIYAIRVAGQPDTIFTWLNTRQWTLEDVQLQSGENVFDVEGIDHDGRVVDQLTFTITKTDNAAPVVAIETSPGSRNVGLVETLALDASGSYDPEGGALSFSWEVSPAEGVTLTPSGAMATANFSDAGIYTFTVSATDDQSQSVSHEVAVAVYGLGGFSTFGDDELESHWGLFNIDKHGNSPDTAYYSLQDNPGRLTIHIPLAQQAAANSPQQYIDYGDDWAYSDTGEDFVGVFADPGFDDSTWPVAPGFLGFGGIGTGPPDPPGFQTNTLGRNGQIAYYFRREFEFSGETVGAQLSIDHLVDDGVVYFLNGQEIGRHRLPDGVITADTPGIPQSDEDLVEVGVIQASITGALVEGTNVFAAQVHNQSAGSSDLIFGAKVFITEGSGAPAPEDETPSWVHRPLPGSGDWILQTEVKLEKAQFGDFLAGLLIGGTEGGSPVRYGLAFDGGDTIAAIRTAGTGSPVTLASAPEDSNLAVIRIERSGDSLLFSRQTGDTFTQIHQVNLPAGTTFDAGGVFGSVGNAEQSLEASFDYAMLIESQPISDVPLVVSEIMYHPVTTSALEFLELYNAGDTPIELAGFRTLDTDPFGEFVFPEFTLQPGAYALLVSDQASFIAEYGPGLAPQIIGQWSGGNLSNAGETITLADADGALITSFTYDDAEPWPLTPDGLGPSLVIVDEDGDLDPGLGTNWRASTLAGGSPGSRDTSASSFDEWMAENGFVDPTAEYGSTGLSNLLAYALGRDLTDGSVSPLVGDGGGFATFSYRQRLGDETLIYDVERSTDLGVWVPATDLSPDGNPVPNGDGTQTVRLLSDTPTPGRPDTYYRLRVTQP